MRKVPKFAAVRRSLGVVLLGSACLCPAQKPAPTIDSARQLIQTGRAEEALKQLDALAAQAPTMPGLERTRGSAYYSLSNLSGADAAYDKALRADPRDQESAQMRGLILYRLGRPAAAIPFLESSHAQGTQTKADPTYVLALCYMATQRFDDARRAFAMQYGMKADSAPAYLLAARMLLRHESLPQAQGYAERALALDPKLPLAHGLLGEIALAQSKVEEAIRDFEQERSINPLEGGTYEHLGDAYSRAGHYEDAQRILQQAVLLEPNSTGPYILLGKVTLRQGDAVAASTFLQHAESMDNSNPITHNLLGQAYKALGRNADAGREFELTQKLQASGNLRLDTVK